jgi:dipeptidyl aminopeptidase/acylaminoacyl peptidase
LALALLGGAVAAPVYAQDASPAKIPPRIATADFAAKPELSSPLLSPDGHWIAARGEAASKDYLAIINADDPNAQPLKVPVADAVIADMNWAGNDKLLLTVMVRAVVYGYVMPAFRLLSFDRTTRQTVIVDPKSRGLLAGDVLYADASGNWALVASQDDLESTPSVKRVDLNTGAATLVEKARHDVWDWYVDSHGAVRGGLAYNSKRWTLWYRDNPGDPLRAVRGKFDKDDDGSVDRFIFGQENGTGEIVTNEKTGRFAAYRYDFKSGEIGEPVYENPKVDIGEVLIEPETGQIRGIRYEDDRWRTHWIDANLSKLQANLDHAVPGAVNEIVELSSDKNRALILSSTASDPGTYFLLDRKAAKMHPVIDPYDRIEPEFLADVQPVSYASRDGLTIPAYLTLPRGREAKGLPLVILPHVVPFTRVDWDYVPIVQFLANRGYAVLQPQFRGSTGYGRQFVESGYGQWGHKMQDDLDDGVDWLVKSGKVNGQRVCIMGGSYGGYAALWGAIRNPEKYRCAVSFAGVSDLSAQLRDNRKSFSATRYFKEWRTKVAGEGKVDVRTVSPIAHADELKVPVLIAHGEEDTTVSPEQSHAMVKALTKANAKVSSVFYKNGDHTWGNAANLADFLTRLDAFLATNNPS